MKTVHFFIAASISATLISSCSSEASSVKKEVTTQKVEQVAVIPTKMLSLEIDGMTCEMGCGSQIRKALVATGGVERVKFDFKMGRATNTAFISFDDSKISETKIEEIVASLNNKQFTLGKGTVADYTPEEKSSGASATTNSSVKINLPTVEPTEGFSFKIPNFIDLIVNVLTKR